MKLIINNFDKLDIETQKEIQDFIAGYTINFILKDNIFMICDVCGEDKIKPKKIETYGSILRVCQNCINKAE